MGSVSCARLGYYIAILQAEKGSALPQSRKGGIHTAKRPLLKPLTTNPGMEPGNQHFNRFPSGSYALLKILTVSATQRGSLNIEGMKK